MAKFQLGSYGEILRNRNFAAYWSGFTFSAGGEGVF
jgi:hypothetical protein